MHGNGSRISPALLKVDKTLMGWSLAAVQTIAPLARCSPPPLAAAPSSQSVHMLTTLTPESLPASSASPTRQWRPETADGVRGLTVRARMPAL